ncbi:hypothetical protein ACIOFV_44535 [Streptomyces mirabilis]
MPRGRDTEQDSGIDAYRNAFRTQYVRQKYAIRTVHGRFMG